MKSLVLVCFVLHISCYTCEDQRLNGEVLGSYLQSFQSVYRDITDDVLANLLKYFGALEYDADPNIPNIRSRCLNEVDRFIYTENAVHKDIVNFMKILDINSFTKYELLRIEDLIKQMSSLQAKIICLSVN